MKVVVLSLAGAEDRRAAFSASVPATRLEWSYFDARTGAAPPLRYDEGAARVARGRAMTPGEIGCYASHYAIWQRLCDDDCDAYVVLEDDVIADWAFLEALADEPLEARGVGYLRLYFKTLSRFAHRESDFVRRSTSIIELFDWAYGTQGYWIAKPAARRLLAASRDIVRPIDDQMDRWWDHGVPNLAVFPSPLIERLGETAIGTARFGAEDAPGHARHKRKERVRKRLAIAARRRAPWPPGPDTWR